MVCRRRTEGWASLICEAALKASDVQGLLYEIPLGRMRYMSGVARRSRAIRACI